MREKGPARTMRDFKRSSKPEEVKSEKGMRNGVGLGVKELRNVKEMTKQAVYSLILVIHVIYMNTQAGYV